MNPGVAIKGWCIGLVAASAFLALSTIGLERQGLYYDEVHQAPAAFYYVGEHPSLFVYPVFGVPVLNMTYSGAIKSAAYGVYLRLSGARFTVFSWRLAGLLFAAAGLLLFYRFGGARLPVASSVLFLGLFLTDTSVTLMTRHDWGPAALSIGLRLTFIGLWISLESHPTWLKILAAGVIMGIALFEKLSAVALLLPFFILLWSMRNRLSGALRLGALGFGIGALPLILVNLQSWVRGAGFISFSDVQSVRNFSIQDTIEFVRGYLELGQGVVVRGFILGEAESSSAAEPLLLLALLSIAVLGLWQYRSNTWMRLGGYFAASYLLVGIALFLLPRPTNFYHWILATPFQYAAGACALAGCLEKTSEVRPGAAYRVVLALSAIGLLAIRIPSIVAVESAFAAGKTSMQFHPDFNRIASLASEKSGDSVFVAADWGTATQIYCVAQGKPGLVYELFWTNPGDATVKFLNETAKPNIYVLVTGIGAQFAAASDEILQVMANAPEWQEAPIEKEFAELQRIKIRKFVRRH